MRRIPSILFVIAVLLCRGTSIGGPRSAVAQDATPAAGAAVVVGRFEPLSLALGVEVTNPSDFFVQRIVLDPGGRFSFDMGDPGAGILLLELGSLTAQVEGTVSVTRGKGFPETVTEAQATGDLSNALEEIANDEAIALKPGDAVFIPAYTAGEIRNDGNEIAVGLVFLVVPASGMSGATPTP